MRVNLKVLGLALVASLVMGAMGASSASAGTALVTGGPTVLGHDASDDVEFTGELGVKCGAATYPGTAEGSTISVGLSFSGCLAAGALPTTITDNGCEYEITMGNLSGHSAPAGAALVCPGVEKEVVIHTYTDGGHNVSNCTIEIPEQGNLDSDLTVTDQTNGHLRIHGTVEGIENYLEPGNEPNGFPSNCVPLTLPADDATLHVDMTVTGGVGLETEEKE